MRLENFNDQESGIINHRRYALWFHPLRLQRRGSYKLKSPIQAKYGAIGSAGNSTPVALIKHFLASNLLGGFVLLKLI